MENCQINKYGPSGTFCSIIVEQDLIILVSNDDDSDNITFYLHCKAGTNTYKVPSQHCLNIAGNYLIGLDVATNSVWSFWKIDFVNGQLTFINYYKEERSLSRGLIRSTQYYQQTPSSTSDMFAILVTWSKEIYIHTVNGTDGILDRINISAENLMEKFDRNTIGLKFVSYNNDVLRIILYDSRYMCLLELHWPSNEPKSWQVITEYDYGSRSIQNIAVHSTETNRFVSLCTVDGRYCTLKLTGATENQLQSYINYFPYGPFPCRSIDKIVGPILKRIGTPHYFVIMGGLPNVTYKDVNSISICKDGESLICFTFYDEVVDFRVEYDETEHQTMISRIYVITRCQLIMLSSTDLTNWTYKVIYPISAILVNKIQQITNIVEISSKKKNIFCSADVTNQITVWNCEKDSISRSLQNIDMTTISALVTGEYKETGLQPWPIFLSCGEWSGNSKLNYQINDISLQSVDSDYAILTVLWNSKCIYRFIIDIEDNSINGSKSSWNFPTLNISFNQMTISILANNLDVKPEWKRFNLMELYMLEDKCLSNLSTVHFTSSYLYYIALPSVCVFNKLDVTAFSVSLTTKTTTMKRFINSFKKSLTTEEKSKDMVIDSNSINHKHNTMKSKMPINDTLVFVIKEFENNSNFDIIFIPDRKHFSLAKISYTEKIVIKYKEKRLKEKPGFHMISLIKTDSTVLPISFIEGTSPNFDSMSSTTSSQRTMPIESKRSSISSRSIKTDRSSPSSNNQIYCIVYANCDSIKLLRVDQSMKTKVSFKLSNYLDKNMTGGGVAILNVHLDCKNNQSNCLLHLTNSTILVLKLDDFSVSHSVKISEEMPELHLTFSSDRIIGIRNVVVQGAFKGFAQCVLQSNGPTENTNNEI